MLQAFFIALLAFSFVAGQLIRLDIFGTFIPLLDVSVFLFIFYNIISRNFSLKKYFSQKYLLIFIGSLVVSNLANISKYTFQENITGSLYLARFVMYSLMLGIENGGQTGRFVPTIKIINAIGLAIASIGILQFLFLPDLRFLQFQNWDDHLGRLTFPFLDPSFTGAILLVFVIIAILCRGTTCCAPTAIILIIELLAIFLTFSRGTWLTTAIVLTMIFLNSKISVKKILWGFGGIGVIGVIGVIVLSINQFSSYGNKIFRTETVTSRVASISKGIKIWQANPIFGVGFNNYKTYQLKNGYYVKNAQDNRGESSVENSFIFVLATSGVVGFVSFLLWTLNFMHPFKGASFKGSGKYLLLSILIGSLFNNLFFYPFLLLVIFMGRSFSAHKTDQDDKVICGISR